MTTITATHHPGGPAAPDAFEVSVLGPSRPVPAYASNFTSGTDGWSSFGTGVGMTNDTTRDPDALHITGPLNTNVSVHAARGPGSLTVGAEYEFSAYVYTAHGNARLAVRGTSEGTEFATGTEFHASKRTRLSLTFTATASTNVVEIFARTPIADPALAADVYVDTVRVDPTGSWTGTQIYRTDANGTDVPVRNPKPYEIDPPMLGVTIYDYEAAMTGPVTYRVVDGTGGTASCTASANLTHSNRAENPIVYPMTAGATPWAGTGATLTTPSNVAIRGTLTTTTATDLAQRISSPAPFATGYFTRGEYQPGDAFQVRTQGRCSLATIAGANVTMVAALVGTQGTISTSDTSLTVSTLPIAGDVLVVYEMVASSTSAITAVAGCGATWARLTPKWEPGSKSYEWWIGTGGNATGSITVTSSASRNGILRAWHIRGLTSPTLSSITQTRTSTSGTTWTGTAVNAQSGQIVLEAAGSGSNSGATYPNPHAPTTGWTVGTVNTNALYGTVNTAYRIPTELTPTSHNATITSSSSQILSVENVVLGVPVTPTTPVPHLKTRLTWYDSGGASLSAVDSNIVTVSDVLWGDMLIDTTVPAAADSFKLDVGVEGTVTRSVGDWFEVHYVLAGRPGTFFYGDTTSTSAYDYEWAATPHASPSLEISTAPPADTAPSLTLPATALLDTNMSPPDFAQLTMATDYSETTESPAAVHVVLGRSDKLSNPAPMLARAGSLTLWAPTYTDAVAVRDLLKSPNTAMFRQANFPGMDLYLVARSVELTPAEPTPTRHWLVAITYDEIPRPQ